MENIKIYQIDFDKEDIMYGFMEYKYAKDHNFKLEDYNLVAEFTTKNTFNTINELLEYIYQIGNDGTLTSEYQMRSVSVSDVIQVNNEYYYVEPFGYKSLDNI